MTEYNKVVYDGQTLIDLTQDDVTQADVRQGVYFHDASGVRSQGTLQNMGKNIWYGTCSTATSTSAKVVTTTSGDFELEAGNMVRVQFDYACGIGVVTLAVDGTTATDVYYIKTSAHGNLWTDGEVVDFVYNGTSFVISDGDVVSSPTAYKRARFDSSAHMNSEDMTSQDVEDFVDGLNVGGGAGQVVVVEDQSKLESADTGTLTLKNCTGTISHNQIYFTKLASGLWFINGRLNINSFTRSGTNPGVDIALPSSVPTPTKAQNFICGFRSQSPREGVVFGLNANSRTATLITHESFTNAANGTLTFIVNGIFTLD